MNFNSYFTIKHTSNLRILLLTLFFIVPLGTIYGQNQLITIAGKNITLLKAFDAIESQTQLSITYSRTKIDVNRTLSVDFKKQKLSIVLDKLLAGTGFTYKIEKGYIVLVPVPVKQEQTEATSKKIQGVIVDTNGDPVIGASIQEKMIYAICCNIKLYIISVTVSYLACFSIYSNGGTYSVILVISGLCLK